jgi:hypothetical protein
MNVKTKVKAGRITANHNQTFPRRLSAALVLAGALGLAANAQAQRMMPPATPAAITPPAGHSAFLLGHASGTQGYVCLPTATGASWTVNASRPQATLFANFLGQSVQIISHFLSPNTAPNQFAPNPLAFGNPTWQCTLDSSKVWAQSLQSIGGGSDASCPNAGAIGCLLLQVIGADPGPRGGKIMTKTTYIQRLNTDGGSAPADGCGVANDVGKQTLVPYTADYYFFRGEK